MHVSPAPTPPECHVVAGSLIPGVKISTKGCWARDCGQRPPSALAGSQRHWLCVSLCDSVDLFCRAGSSSAPCLCWSGVDREQSGRAHHLPGEVSATQCCWHCWKAGLWPQTNPCLFSSKAKAWKTENQVPVSGFRKQHIPLGWGGKCLHNPFRSNEDPLNPCPKCKLKFLEVQFLIFQFSSAVGPGLG